MECKKNIKKCALIIKKNAPDFQPKIGLILGSGLGAICEHIENSISIDYKNLPGFYVSSILGQPKKMHLGWLKGVPVACLEGRTHYYEGIEEAKVSLCTIIRTLKKIGCEILLTTNAVGSLISDIGPGNLMVIKDHINFTFNNPLAGKNDAEFGERFFSMDNAYDSELRAKILKVGKKLHIPLTEAVYIATLGPSFETPAEIRAFKILGADAVGMSTVPETLLARHCGMKVISVCTVTNWAAGMSKVPLSHEVTLKGAALGTESLVKLFLEFIGEIGTN